MSRLTYNVSNSNPLIPRQQTYMLDRKLVTIHSEDRDIKKYPESNRFSIQLPVTLENVQSVRLVECTFPINYYVFSRQYQNTKLTFTIDSIDINSDYHTTLSSTPLSEKLITIEIQEGFYCPDELATELQERMNQGVTDKLNQLMPATTQVYNLIRVYYDKVGQRFWFGVGKDLTTNKGGDVLTLFFNKKEEYPYCCPQPIMWEKTVNWGIGWYLGFERAEYSTAAALDENGNPADIKFNYLGQDGIWLKAGTTKPYSKPAVQFLVAPFAPNIFGERAIYMELNKFNSMDELVPGPNNSNAQHNNTYTAIVNSAFAKIPITNKPLGELNDSRNGFLQNITHMDIPEEKISKLDFLFRYHDGRLVDFGTSRFNFTLEFNCLKNEIGRDFAVRIPLTYQL